MLSWGYDVNQVGTTNFQAIKTWNDGNNTWGGVSNFMRIPHDEVLNVRDMQDPELFEGVYYSQNSKMEWLCSFRGSLYMYEEDRPEWEWEVAPHIRWGTTGLGGNIVQVESYETIRTSVDGEPLRDYQVARLVGFKKTDWNKSREDLLETGLVHVVSCVYRDNAFSWNSPKGRCYSPFFSPTDYDFAGTAQPSALYTLVDWLEG